MWLIAFSAQPSSANVSPPASTEPTNIVYIMVDDLGYADLSPKYMPRLYALREQLGTQMPFYTMQNCAPTRTALMTGGLPADLDILGVDSPPFFKGVPVQEVLLSERMQEAGYRTGIFGKWHLGLRPEQNPINNGFDEYVGLIHGWANYYGPQENGKPYPDGSIGHDHQGAHDFQYNGVPLYDSTYVTFLIGRAAERFIETSVEDNKPFFAYLPFNAPHGPTAAPRAYVDMYRDEFAITDVEYAKLFEYEHTVLAIPYDSDVNILSRNKLAKLLYYAAVRALDDAVAEVYDALVTAGVANNTLFMFASDNGASQNTNRPGNNGHLRGGKGTPYEGGHRVANALIWPEALSPGHTINANVWVGDLYETFLAVAGVRLNDPELESNNMLPAILSGQYSFARKHGGQHIVTHMSKGLYKGRLWTTWAINNAWQKYIVQAYFDPQDDELLEFREEFYNIVADPGETENLIAHPSYQRSLQRLRRKFLATGGLEYFRSWKTTSRGWQGWWYPEEWGFGTRVFGSGEKIFTSLF